MMRIITVVALVFGLLLAACSRNFDAPPPFPQISAFEPERGFMGDRVEISAEPLGKLVNWVNHTDAIPRWEYGVSELIDFLTQTHSI